MCSGRYKARLCSAADGTTELLVQAVSSPFTTVEEYGSHCIGIGSRMPYGSVRSINGRLVVRPWLPAVVTMVTRPVLRNRVVVQGDNRVWMCVV